MFKSIEYYKPGYLRVIERYKELYKAGAYGNHLVYAMPAINPPEPLPALNKVDFDKGLEPYLDLTLRNYAAQLEAIREIPDDLLPSAGLFFGIGDYSAYIAGEVVFTEDTSWAAPVIEKWEDLDRLTLDPENLWVKRLERATRHIVARTKDSPVPIVRGYYSPLDMAHALRGEKLFTDFFDAPDQVNRLMQFATDAVIWMARRLQAIIGLTWGGNVAGAWLPPGSVCMSEDIACMVSPRTYAKFARPYTQQVIDAFGHGQIHTHSLGLKNIPEIAKLNNLMSIQISDDPNTPRAFEQLEDLLPRCNGMPLTVGCTLEEVRRDMDKLKDLGNIIFAGFVPDVAAGKELVSLVRRNSRIQ